MDNNKEREPHLRGQQAAWKLESKVIEELEDWFTPENFHKYRELIKGDEHNESLPWIDLVTDYVNESLHQATHMNPEWEQMIEAIIEGVWEDAKAYMIVTHIRSMQDQ